MDIAETRKIEAYLQRLFGNSAIRVVPQPRRGKVADVYVGSDKLGEVSADEEDEEDYNFSMRFEAGATAGAPELTNYLARKLGSDRIRILRRAKKQDSFEAYLDEEYIGLLFVEEGKAARRYVLEIPILGFDL